MTINKCLCRLHFVRGIVRTDGQLYHESSPARQAGFIDDKVDVESAVQPPATAFRILIVTSFARKYRLKWQHSVVVFAGNDETEIERFLSYCESTKPAVALLARRPLSLPEVTFPVFVLEPETISRVVQSGKNTVVSIQVLRPLPSHVLTSANSSISTEKGNMEEEIALEKHPDEIIAKDSSNHDSSITELASVSIDKTKQLGKLKERIGSKPNVDVERCVAFAFTITFALMVFIILSPGPDASATEHYANISAAVAPELVGTIGQLNHSLTGNLLLPEVCCVNSTKCMTMYPSVEDEARMRCWLNDNKLAQYVGDKLIQSGVRDMEDVTLLAKLDVGFGVLNELAELDMLKIRHIVHSLKSDEDESQEPSRHQERLPNFRNLTAHNNQADEAHPANEPQRVFIERLLDVLGAGFALTTIRAAALLWRHRNGGIEDPVVVFVSILLPSALRSVWFVIPNSMWRPSDILFGDVDSGIGRSRGGFLSLSVVTAGSWVVFIVVTLPLVATVRCMSKYLNPAVGHSWIAMFGTFSAAASASVSTVFWEGLSIQGMFFAEAVLFATLSILAVCWLNAASVHIFTDFATNRTSINRTHAQAMAVLAKVSAAGNFFFFTRAVLEVLSVMIMILVHDSHGATEMRLHAWLDICFVSKFICELAMLVYDLETLQPEVE